MHFKTLALLFAVVYLVVVTVTSANPIDIDENDLPICPEGCECNFLFCPSPSELELALNESDFVRV